MMNNCRYVATLAIFVIFVFSSTLINASPSHLELAINSDEVSTAAVSTYKNQS